MKREQEEDDMNPGGQYGPATQSSHNPGLHSYNKQGSATLVNMGMMSNASGSMMAGAMQIGAP
jgi:hypothetical protein